MVPQFTPGRRICLMPRLTHPRTSLAALAAAAGLLLAGCSGPPSPAPEPTGAELERAWRIAVGSDPLDQTVAELYSQALNAHETPATVVEDSDAEATELAVALGEESESAEQSAEDADDERFEMVLARTIPLARTLDPEGYAELTEAQSGDEPGPAAAPEELTELIEAELADAELLEPAPAVLRSAMLITSITEADFDAESEEVASLDALAEHCSDLTIGVRSDTADSQELLEEVYDCQPQEWVVEEEDTLIQALITAEIDAALITTSHPGAVEHALTSLEDSQRAFAHDQYAPVVASRIAEGVPEVVHDISAALDDEALTNLRRLIRGDQGLEPEEAAEYWLVEHDFIAEPDVWG